MQRGLGGFPHERLHQDRNVGLPFIYHLVFLVVEQRSHIPACRTYVRSLCAGEGIANHCNCVLL
ncbi:hypothetical protein [Moorena sp. SIO3E8]|uniref:hypothetical protein n=1 Tax=Moorena sp. SIO3E8 TaxID=2607830 RepID=UPI0025D01E9E|nr:hypothetical protein [Moorena sp. SIO3E8]